MFYLIMAYQGSFFVVVGKINMLFLKKKEWGFNVIAISLRILMLLTYSTAQIATLDTETYFLNVKKSMKMVEFLKLKVINNNVIVI